MGYDVCEWGSSLGIIRLRVLGLRFLAVRGDCASAIVRLRSIVDRRLSSDANIMKAHPMSLETWRSCVQHICMVSLCVTTCVMMVVMVKASISIILTTRTGVCMTDLAARTTAATDATTQRQYL